MNKPARIFFFIVAVLFSLACGMTSLIPNLPPKPGTSNVPTGSSPMSGDWTVNAEFGKFAFTVDPDGKNVTTAVFELSGWACGGTTLSTSLQSLSQWPLTDGQFAGMVNLNGNFHTMTVVGTYDKANKQFVGTWEQNAHGSICSGNWEAIPRK
jgi:Trk-type K+ transport system membrane component